MSIVGYPDYPPRIQIHLTKANPEIWTLGVEGLTEAVQFVVLPYQMQVYNYARPPLHIKVHVLNTKVSSFQDVPIL